MLLEKTRRPWAERERSVALWMHRGAAHPWVVNALLAVSRAGDGLLWYALIASLPWWGGPAGGKCALYMVALGLVNLVFYKALKQRIARPRPYVSCPGIRACGRSLDEFSFPSGHTMHAMAFSLVLVHYHPALAWPLWAFTLLVALSRVVLGLHYPSDVAIGAAIGWLTAKFMLVIV
ncbi:MAG TPA: phosphatase PAP2 family protein [Albitalea sp.]|uniref:phosphatase PAP2 family protein n=1 Tax=Piscinibacter sp. TaxID=1903157 RepID=UPI002ED23F36